MKPLAYVDLAAQGFDPKQYSGDPLPEGSWTGVLDFRVWGQANGCLHCYFTDQNGDHRRVAAFPIERGALAQLGAFGARDGGLDMAADGLENRTFALVTGKNMKERPAWRSITPID